tara:strand:+ start:13116 stop:13421 length:306 start_codon:yes stop_codon:yes gene_type:complete
MLKDLLKIKKINKNMKKFVDIQINFFENILKKISNKKYINNKYMGTSFSYGIVALNDYNSRNSSRNSNNEYKLIENNVLDIDLINKKNKIKKIKIYNNING